MLIFKCYLLNISKWLPFFIVRTTLAGYLSTILSGWIFSLKQYFVVGYHKQVLRYNYFGPLPNQTVYATIPVFFLTAIGRYTDAQVLDMAQSVNHSINQILWSHYHNAQNISQWLTKSNPNWARSNRKGQSVRLHGPHIQTSVTIAVVFTEKLNHLWNQFWRRYFCPRRRTPISA